MASPTKLIEKLQSLRPDTYIEWLVINGKGEVISMNLKGDALSLRNVLNTVAELKQPEPKEGLDATNQLLHGNASTKRHYISQKVTKIKPLGKV